MAGYAFVDVETTGLDPESDRIISVAALVTDHRGRVVDTFETLLDPGRNPGPTWLHGLTSGDLHGAPRFDQVVGRLHGLFEGRVLVAHNALFDHAFLFHESRRAGRELPVGRRLCTVALARRLDVPVPSYRLTTLAEHFRISVTRPHHAPSDVHVLHQVFLRSAELADGYGVALPVVAVDGHASVSQVRRPRPRREMPFVNPERWALGDPLVQGMKVVITGETRAPRPELERRLIDAGLHVTGSVSRQTRLLVCNDLMVGTRKLRAAQEHGTAICTEQTLNSLLDNVRPGEPQTGLIRPATDSRRLDRPWSGTRVLVLGGNHDDAVKLRERLAELGARPLVTLAATTTHVVLLPGGEHDPRMAKVRDRQLIVLAPDQITDDPPRVSEAAATEPAQARSLVRGEALDLPPDLDRLTMSVSWSPAAAATLDVVAVLVDSDGRVRSDEDVVFYNAPATPDGAVALTVDGDAEQGIEVRPDDVDPEVCRVIVGAVLEKGTFGGLGPIQVSFEAVPGQRLATCVLDAATSEQTLILVEVYRRGELWRARPVGRGYESGLREWLIQHGVTIAG